MNSNSNNNNIIDRIRNKRSICKASTIVRDTEINVSKQCLSYSFEYVFFNELFMCKPPMSTVYYLTDIESMCV